jgi:hypothetical protein
MHDDRTTNESRTDCLFPPKRQAKLAKREGPMGVEYRGVLVDDGVITWRCADLASSRAAALQDARVGGCRWSTDGPGNGWTEDMAWMPEDKVRERRNEFYGQWIKATDFLEHGGVCS